MNDLDIFNEVMGFSPEVTTQVEEPEELITPSVGNDEDIFSEVMGFAPPKRAKVEAPVVEPPPEEPLEAPAPEMPEVTESETPEMTAPETRAPTSTLEFTEPTEIKPTGLTEKYVPPSPTPSYGTFGVQMAPPPAVSLQEKTAAYVHRTLAAGKKLIAPEVERTAFLQPDQEKREERAKTAVELPKEAVIHGKAAEYLDPTWYTSEKINERIERIRGQDPNLANSFLMGDITGAADINVANAFMSGDKTAMNIALDIQRQAREAAGEFQKKRQDRKGFTGDAINVLESISGMLPMMGKSAAQSAIPVVGPLISTSMWAKQGAGDIITELKDKGVDDDTALAYGLAGGLAYSLVEQVQVGRVLNTQVKKAIGNSVKKKIAAIAKEKGIDWFKNVREEVIQGLITENTIISALEASGVEVDRKEMNERYKKTMKENIKGSFWQMGILSALGFSGGATRVALTERTTSKAAAETESVPETGPVLETESVPETGPVLETQTQYATLADYGMDVEEFNSLSDEDQYEIAKELSPQEREKILAQEKPVEKITPEAKEDEVGLQREAEAEIKEDADLPGVETVTEPVVKEPVPAPKEMTTKEKTEIKKDVESIPRKNKIEKEEIKKVDVAPSEEQKKAGNYQKAHIKRDGFDISIENPAGSQRSGTDPTGKKWSQKINHDYGYIRGTKGADAFRDAESTDQVDVFIKPNSTEGGTVYVINQIDPASGKFDEHKVMMGFDSQEEAKKAYLSNYEKGWKGLESTVEMPMDEFKEWVYTDATEKSVKQKEVPSAEEIRETVRETGKEERPVRGEEGRIRVRDDEEYRLATEEGEKQIRTPRGVSAKAITLPKPVNVDSPNYEPVLNLNKKPTGWLRPKNNPSVIVNPITKQQITFNADKPEAVTAAALTRTAATGHAINNPVIKKEAAVKSATEIVRERLGLETEVTSEEKKPVLKEKKRELREADREALVSPTIVTEGEIPAAKEIEKKKKIASEEKPKKKPKFAKGEKVSEKPAEKKVTKAEKELTDIVYSRVDKPPKYGTIQIVTDIKPGSDIEAISKTVEETTGKKVIFIKTDDRSLKSTLGFTVDGLSIPGDTEGKFKDTIFVNISSDRPILWTAYHEFAHFLETNPNYKKRFWGAVRLTDRGMAEFAKEGESELTADIIGEMMSRQDFWKNLAKQGRTPFQKFMQEFLRIINKIRNSIRRIIGSDKLPQYENLLIDTNTMRDEIARIYSDYRKTTGKEIGDIPARMVIAIKREKVMFAKKKSAGGKPQLPKRKIGLLPGKKERQLKLSDISGASKEALEAERIFEKQNEDVRNKFNKSIKDRWELVKSFLGEKIWDRSYYSKNMLGKSTEAKQVIGKLNASKGNSANAKMIYETVEEKTTANLPYYLEDTLANYIEAVRIVEIEKVKGEGKVKHTGGMTLEQAEAFIYAVENNLNKRDSLAIKIAAGRYWNAMLGQLKALRDSGIITEDLYKKLSSEGKHYSPRRFLQHIDPEKNITTPSGQKISVRESGIQALAEGSEEAMINNWRLLLSDVISRTQSRIFKNEAAKALGKFVESNPDNLFGGEIEQPAGREMDLIDVEGIVDNLQGENLKLRESLAKATTGAQIFNIENKIDENSEKIDRWGKRIQAARTKGEDKVFIEYKKQPPLSKGSERIYFIEDGDTKAVLVPKKFADSWNQNDVQINRTTANFLNTVFGGALVRPFATGAFAPEFALSNIPRDMALQWIATQEYSKAAPVAVIQNLDNFRRVFKDAWHGTGRYEEYVKQGGGMEFLNEQGSSFRKDPTKAISPTSVRNKKIMDAMRKLQEFSERLTRLALREQAIKNGKTPQEATIIAREYLDFAQGGSLTKALDNAVPYLNASVQGARSVVEAAVEDPATFSIKAGQLIMMGAAVALMAGAFRRREWDEISDREKVSRWNFPLGMAYKNKYGEENHIYISIPKDQSSRIFATIGETIIEMMSHSIDGETAWKRIRMAFDDMSPIDTIGMLPPTLSALIGYALNINFWKEDKIWKGREVSPYKEVYEGRTPGFYADLAEGLNKIEIDLSPERMHQSLQQVMPRSLLSSLMGGAYEGITAALSKEDKLELNKMFFEHWSKLPGIRKYIRATYPSKTDYQKLFEQAVDYEIPLNNKDGKRKSEAQIKHEIEKKERQKNDIRQEHDNEASIVSEMLLTGKNVDALERWNELKIDAAKNIKQFHKNIVNDKELRKEIKKEIDRINKRIIKRIEKNDNKNIYRTLLKE